MKILHLIDSGGLYGAEKMLLALMQEQLKAGITPVLLSCGEIGEGPKPIEIEAKKLNVEVIDWRMKPGLNLRGMFNITSWAKEQKVDVFHSHGFKFNVLIGLVPKVFRRPFKWIVTVHGFIPAKLFSKSFIYQFLDKKLSRLSDQLCLVSPAMLEISDFKRHQKTSVILNGISSDAVSRRNTKKKSDVLNLLAIGRLSPEKGFDYLIKAIETLKSNKDLTIELSIMGEGQLKQALVDTIAQSDITNQVKLVGFVDEPVRHFSKYDALVMPSLTEGIPITLLEALRERLPVLASRVGGIPFVLGEDYDYLFEPADIESLVNKLVEFTKKIQLDIDKLTEQNHQRFLDNFTSKKMHNDYLAIYNKVLNII